MKRALFSFTRFIYRNAWVQKIVNIARRKSIAFLKTEVKTGSLSYAFKASVYAGELNLKFKTILESMPTEIVHKDLSAFYTEKILIEAIDDGHRLDKLLLDLGKIETFLKIAKEPKKNTPIKVSSILFVTSIFPSVEHGGGLKVFDTIQELVALGYKVSLYSHYHEDHDLKSYNHLLPSLAHVRLVNLENFQAKDFNEWMDRKNLTFDLAHYVWPHASAVIPRDHSRIKCHVFDFIETTARRCIMGIESMLETRDFKQLGLRLFDLVESMLNEARASAYCDKFICITEKDAEFSRDLYKIPEPHVVQIGVSRHAILDPLNDSLAPKIEPKPLSVGFIGNFNHYPNIDGVEWYLNHVHPLVVARVPDYIFHVIGYGLPDSLKLKYKDPSVNFVGAVDNVIDALRPLSVCVAPLISGAGFRVKLNQFSVMHKPTVSTTIGACGMPYINGKSMFISDDGAEFADDVVSLLKDPNLNSEMGRQAYQVVEQNYFWGPHIKKLVQAYEN